MRLRFTTQRGSVHSPHCGPVLAPTGTYAEDQSVSALPGQVPSYHADGYLYAVTVPAGYTVTVTKVESLLPVAAA